MKASHAIDAEPKAPEASAPAAEAGASTFVSQSSNILFTTKTCPNCKVANALLEKAGVDFEKLYVEDNKDLAMSYGFKQVPAFITTSGEQFVGVPEIKTYLSK